MQVRNWLHVCVTILDKLEDEFHLGLVGLDWDFLIDSMDAEGEKFWGRGHCFSTQVIAEHPTPL